jgi:hypothetical protein
MTQLIFYDAGTAFLLVAFLALCLFSPLKVYGRTMKSGDFSVVFTIILCIYVGIRWYFGWL